MPMLDAGSGAVPVPTTPTTVLDSCLGGVHLDSDTVWGSCLGVSICDTIPAHRQPARILIREQCLNTAVVLRAVLELHTHLA